MQNLNCLIFVILIVYFGSCAEPGSDGNESLSHSYFEINIPDDLHVSGMIPADSVFSAVSYIPLEYNSDAVLSECEQIKLFIEEDLIYVLDLRQRVVVCFSSDGKHLKTLARRGRGPDEYSRVGDLFVDSGTIYLLCESPEQIVVYDKDHNYVKRISLPFDATSFAKSNSLFYIHTKVNREEKYAVHIIDSNGVVLNKYMTFEELSIPNNLQSMWVHNGAVYAEFANDYSVYELTKEGSRVYATLDFGKDNLPTEAKNWGNYMSDKTADYVRQNNYRPPQGLGNVFVNDQYLIVQYVGFLLRRSLIWNKVTGEIYDKAISNTEDFPVVQGTRFRWLIDNKLYTLTPAGMISRLVENGYGNFPQEIAAITPDDNFILTIYTLK